MELIQSDPEIIDLLFSETPLLDVRSEIEFQKSSLDSSINIPLLKTDQRSEVGTTYKQLGKEQAINLGHKLISGYEREDKIRTWIQSIQEKNIKALYCARGGLRSKISQEWLFESGVHIPRIAGGYKTIRTLLLRELERILSEKDFILLAGKTGTGKTKLIQRNPQISIDLEKLANHKGSVFGGDILSQPAQGTFENNLCISLFRLPRKIFVESESPRIGKIQLPNTLILKMRAAPVILLEEPIEKRVLFLIDDYVKYQYQKFHKDTDSFSDCFLLPLQKLSQLLSKDQMKFLSQSIIFACQETMKFQEFHYHQEWIKALLEWHYDPLYRKHHERYADRIVWTGSSEELRECLGTLS